MIHYIQKNTVLKYALLGVCFVALFFVGYVRDYVFVNINYELIDIYYKRNEWQMPANLSYFEHWEYARLYYFKYTLTALFVLLYLVVSLASVALLFKPKKYLLYTAIAYITVVVVAYALNNTHLLGIDGRQAYLFSRELMGFVQSPFIFIVLISVFFLAEKQEGLNTQL
ncbi:MAG: hypothetical protein ABL940_06255 [Bacteroidia bacterium]